MLLLLLLYVVMPKVAMRAEGCYARALPGEDTVIDNAKAGCKFQLWIQAMRIIHIPCLNAYVCRLLH